MIQVKSLKEGGIILTNRQQSITLKERQVILEDDVIESCGEYETNGIEVLYGTNASLIVWEGLQICYIFDLSNPTAFEKNEFAPCNALVVDGVQQEMSKQAFTLLIESYDPNIVIVSRNCDITKIKDSYKFADADLVKVSEQTLPVEGRDLYQLK